MEDVLQKKRLLQSEISRILQEMIALKMNSVKDSVHATTGKALTQKVRQKIPFSQLIHISGLRYI